MTDYARLGIRNDNIVTGPKMPAVRHDQVRVEARMRNWVIVDQREDWMRVFLSGE